MRTSAIAPSRAAHRFEARHDEPGVGRQVEVLDAGDDLVAQGGIEVHAVGLHERARAGVVALGLDPLDLGEQAPHARP